MRLINPTKQTREPRYRLYRGFSLVEATVSILLVSTVVLGALHVQGSALVTQRRRAEATDEQKIIELLASEIMQSAYQDPEITGTWGREGAESSSDRTTWDDVDDFDGLSGTPSTPDGQALLQYEDWTWSVSLRFVDPITLAPLGTADDQGLKQIEIEVVSPRAEAFRAVLLRSAHSPFERATASDRAFTSEIAYTLADAQTTRESRVLTLNEPYISANLVDNAGFELGTQSWDGQGATLSIQSTNPNSGAQCVRVSGRPGDWAGLNQYVLVDKDATYRAEAWVRPDSDATARIQIVVQTWTGYTYAMRDFPALAGEWTRVSALLSPTWNSTFISASVEVVLVGSLGAFEVDDVVLQRVPGS